MGAAGLAVEAFYDPDTGTVSYVVADEPTAQAAVIDPVLDLDLRSGRTGTASTDRLLAFVRARQLQVRWILETHAHADHLSAARYVQEMVGGRIGIGERILEVQQSFGRLYNLEEQLLWPDGHFDHLFREGEQFRIGNSLVTVLSVPGHTPADVAYLVGDALFAGDTLFMPDVGSARADFPGGDARTLYRSMRRLLALPDATRMFVCHDYPKGREPRWETTVAQQRTTNIHVRDGIAEDAFVALRTARDATLALPALMLPAMQVNMLGGRMPAPEANGVAYLRIPLNAFGSAR